MTEEPKDDLSAVIAGVQLVDVRLVEAAVRTRIRHVRAVPNSQLVATHGTTVMQRSDDGFIVAAMLRAQVVSEGQQATDDAPVFMNVTFALQYSLLDAKRFSDEVLGEFARVNAAFNAWPYWREYVQTTAARMNLPPLVLPVFRVRPAASQAPKIENRNRTPSKQVPEVDKLTTGRGTAERAGKGKAAVRAGSKRSHRIE